MVTSNSAPPTPRWIFRASRSPWLQTANEFVVKDPVDAITLPARYKNNQPPPLSKNRRPNLVAIPRASRKTERPGRNRPGHSKQTSPLLSSSADGAQRSAVLPRRRRAALPLPVQARRYPLRHWRSWCLGPVLG